MSDTSYCKNDIGAGCTKDETHVVLVSVYAIGAGKLPLRHKHMQANESVDFEIKLFHVFSKLHKY
jgi:hypothetical protein